MFKFGPYVPIVKIDDGILIDNKGIVDYYVEQNPQERLSCEVLPDDAFVEAPSLVTPFLLKKRTIWPPRERLVSTQVPPNECPNDGDSSMDDVQVIKVVTTNASKPMNSRPIDEYVRSTAVATLTSAKLGTNQINPILSIDDYFKSSVGQLLLSVGLSRVTEFNLEDNTRRLASKIKRGGENAAHLTAELNSLKSQLSQARASNRPYKSDKILRCPHCSFKTDVDIVLSGHLEIPHMSFRREHLCNWCPYKVKCSNQIVFHTLVQHKKRCLIEKPLSLHCCRFCPYECKSKRKMTSHLTRCQLVYLHNVLLGPQELGEYDFPAVTSKFITQSDVRAYEQILKDLRLAAYNPHQLKVSGFRQGSAPQPLMLVPRANNSSSSVCPLNSVVQPVIQPVNHHTTLGRSSLDGMSFMNGKAVINTASDIIMTFQKQPPINGTKNTTAKGSTFVICEICDGYINDLNQLRSHMQWIHKVCLFQK